MQRSFSSSVKQHLLLSYNQSFAAVLRAQHAGKVLRWANTRCGGLEYPGIVLQGWLAARQDRRQRTPMLPGPALSFVPWSIVHHCCSRCSGGPQATALLAACPAVRELLLKPLAIRHASLKRFILASGGSDTRGTAGAAGAGQMPRPSPFDMPPEQVLVSDLSGDVLEAAAETLEAAGRAQQAAQLREPLQSSPSGLAMAVLSDALDTLLF